MRRHLGPIACALFFLSLALPALVVDQKPLFAGAAHEEVIYGAHCLLLGYFVWPGWLANPLLLMSWLVGTLARGRPRHLAIATGLAVLAIVSAVIAPFILMELDMMRLRHPHAGYYVWLASVVLAAFNAYLTQTGPDPNGPDPEGPRDVEPADQNAESSALRPGDHRRAPIAG